MKRHPTLRVDGTDLCFRLQRFLVSNKHGYEVRMCLKYDQISLSYGSVGIPSIRESFDDNSNYRLRIGRKRIV